MKITGNEPMYPTTEWKYQGDGCHGWETIQGLTKREYFTGLAIQGLLANPHYGPHNFDCAASDALRITDKLINELNK